MQNQEKESPDLKGLKRNRCPENECRKEPGPPHDKKVNCHTLGGPALFCVDHETHQGNQKPEIEKTSPEFMAPDQFRKTHQFSQISHLGHDRDRPRGGDFAPSLIIVGDPSDGDSECIDRSQATPEKKSAGLRQPARKTSLPVKQWQCQKIKYTPIKETFETLGLKY